MANKTQRTRPALGPSAMLREIEQCVISNIGFHLHKAFGHKGDGAEKSLRTAYRALRVLPLPIVFQTHLRKQHDDRAVRALQVLGKAKSAAA